MPDLIRDTSPQADAIQLQILRQMPPARRGYLATSLSRTVLRSSRQGIAHRTPTFTAQQIVAASIAINYGTPWAARVQPRLASSEDAMLDPLLHTALTPVIDLFDQLGIRYHLGGSLASSIHGVPRATLDADVVASRYAKTWLTPACRCRDRTVCLASHACALRITAPLTKSESPCHQIPQHMFVQVL